MYQNGWFCTSIISKIDFTKILSHRRILFFSTLYVMTYKWKLTKILNLEEKENLQNVHNSRVKKLLLQNLFMVVFMETRAFIFHLYYEDRRSRQRYSSPSFSSGTWTFELAQKFLAPMEKNYVKRLDVRQLADMRLTARASIFTWLSESSLDM